MVLRGDCSIASITLEIFIPPVQIYSINIPIDFIFYYGKYAHTVL